MMCCSAATSMHSICRLLAVRLVVSEGAARAGLLRTLAMLGVGMPDQGPGFQSNRSEFDCSPRFLEMGCRAKDSC